MKIKALKKWNALVEQTKHIKSQNTDYGEDYD